MKRAAASSGVASLVVVALGLCWPARALACSVCFLAQEETRVAFVATTALLTLLPLAFVGSVVWWLYDKARKLEREEADG